MRVLMSCHVWMCCWACGAHMPPCSYSREFASNIPAGTLHLAYILLTLRFFLIHWFRATSYHITSSPSFLYSLCMTLPLIFQIYILLKMVLFWASKNGVILIFSYLWCPASKWSCFWSRRAGFRCCGFELDFIVLLGFFLFYSFIFNLFFLFSSPKQHTSRISFMNLFLAQNIFKIFRT